VSLRETINRTIRNEVNDRKEFEFEGLYKGSPAAV
jgi:hypothetical protein